MNNPRGNKEHSTNGQNQKRQKNEEHKNKGYLKQTKSKHLKEPKNGKGPKSNTKTTWNNKETKKSEIRDKA